MKVPKDVDSRNIERCSWALVALKEFQRITGSDDEDALSDLLCDLMHLSDRMVEKYENFDDALVRGISHYEAETGRAPY